MTSQLAKATKLCQFEPTIVNMTLQCGMYTTVVSYGQGNLLQIIKVNIVHDLSAAGGPHNARLPVVLELFQQRMCEEERAKMVGAHCELQAKSANSLQPDLVMSVNRAHAEHSSASTVQRMQVKS